MRFETPFDVDSITVLRPGRRVVNGSVYEDWTTPAEHTLERCSITPGPSDEDHERADGVEVEYSAQAPLGSDITEADRVRFEYAGQVFEGYQVHGRPRPMADPMGLAGHLVVEFVKREG